MRRISSPTVLLSAVGLLTLIGGVVTSSVSSRQAAAAPAAQGGTSLTIDDCTELDEGDTANLTISINNTPALFAWEVYFAYDRDLIEVVGRDVRLFLSEGANSNVVDVSDPVPNSTGIYRLGAADVGLDSTAEDGGGQLATIAVRAKSEGVSPAAIFKLDSIPLGPRLTGVGGSSISDFNGDGVFDGNITSGQIAIGVSCDPVAPTPNPELPDDIIVITSPTIAVTDSPSSPGATAEPDGSGGPNASARPTDGPSGTEPADGGTPGPSDDVDSSATGRPPDDGDTSGAGGFASGSDDTFWAIVLIGGGIGLGLLITLIIAVATRKRA